MSFIVTCFAFAAGYATSVYSWTAVRTWIGGAETEIRSLEDRLDALKAKL